MGKLMRQDRLLLIGGSPVEQVHGLRLIVVVARDLLLQQADKEWLQLKVPVEKAKLLEHDFLALHLLGVLVVLQLVLDVLLYLITGNESAFDLVLDGEFAVFAGKGQNLVYRPK